MAKINLLPWREELRQQRQKDFIAAIVAGVVVTLILLMLVWLHIEDKKEYQLKRNGLLDKEIQFVNKKIKEIRDIDKKKAKLLTKIEVIQTLQESRPQIVHLFEELPKSTPDGVFLLKFKQTGKNLTFKGKAQSQARVSAYMKSIEASPWLESPVLDVIKGTGKESQGSLNNFSMRAKQGEHKAKDSEAMKK